MIVGPTGGGKTECYQTLAHSMTELRKKESANEKFKVVEVDVLNPKSITMGELYGQEDPDSKEWTDGLASTKIRRFTLNDESINSWTVFDGPVDAIWIENMNTVLDDNMTLCLANGERIKLKSQMRMLFEVQDLAVASPATVSRCGMVYMTPSDIGWKPYVDKWIF